MVKKQTKEEKEIEAAEEVVAEVSPDEVKAPEAAPDPALVAAVAKAVLEAIQSQPSLAPVAPAPSPAPSKPIVVVDGTETTVAKRLGLSGASAHQVAAMNQPNSADDALANGSLPEAVQPQLAEAPKSYLEQEGKETGKVIRVAQN
jgi:hypothetical protein